VEFALEKVNEEFLDSLEIRVWQVRKLFFNEIFFEKENACN
jgi:hypothetical protein